ncbi:hypothetical protein [Erythrobacter sp. WG]|uniref:hypothetical protein n=1 Tax=Erythrobacter sp. WG TaxID=2985510 RepID=UPI00226D5BB4|nr:hypothetical protein [Erythrobacter sp. WG]MCX9146579.1 hypothetical protein [Erythrobacter sp. WG]
MSLLELTDIGFADRALIRPLVRRIALKSAIADVRTSIEALADLLHEEREPLCSDDAALREQGVPLPCGDEQCGLCGGAIGLRESHALREHELLEGVDLVAQLIERIEIGVRHGLFSSASDAEASRAAAPAHRLSRGAK